jgi:hypothetical protein
MNKYEFIMVNHSTGERWETWVVGENRELALQKFLRRKFVSKYFCDSQGDHIVFYIDKEK